MNFNRISCTISSIFQSKISTSRTCLGWGSNSFHSYIPSIAAMGMIFVLDTIFISKLYKLFVNSYLSITRSTITIICDEPVGWYNITRIGPLTSGISAWYSVTYSAMSICICKPTNWNLCPICAIWWFLQTQLSEMVKISRRRWKIKIIKS